MKYILLIISFSFFGCNLPNEENKNEFFNQIKEEPKVSYLKIEKTLKNFESVCEVIHYPSAVYSNNFAGIIKFYKLDKDKFDKIYFNYKNKSITYQNCNVISFYPNDSNILKYESSIPKISNICNNNVLIRDSIEYMLIDNKEGLFLSGKEGQYLKKVNEYNGFSSGLAFIEEEQTIANFLIIW